MSVADEIRKLVELRDAGHLDAAEFERAKARVLHAETAVASGLSEVQRLRRSVADRWFGGVCGGLGRYTGTESWLWRLLFTVAFLFAGFGLLPYILLWIFVPIETSSSVSSSASS
jgi:phage shock protein PspC (stress-responsive transcriptional regulator)